MAYVRTRWVSRTTPLAAENMNNIEDGIEEAKAHANGNDTMWSYIMDRIGTVLGLTSSQYNGNAATATEAVHATSADAALNADTVANHTVAVDVPGDATTSAAGLMSAADKTKLNGIATGATQNTTASLIDLIYPVGSIYMSVNSTNPGTRFGRGTWVAWGAGRVPVGINSSDSSFNSVEKTGGSKNAVLPSHQHTFTGTALGTHRHSGPSHTHSVNDGDSRFLTVATSPDNAVTRATVVTQADGALQYASNALFSDNPVVRYTNTSAAGTGNTSAVSAGTPSGTISTEGESATNANLQPYITCYMWKRTA